MGEKKVKRKKFFEPSEFFYITHIDNLKNILSEGIFCHKKALEKGYLDKEISNPEIIEMRKNKEINGISLWDYANIYIRVTNAMLYKVVRKLGIENIVILSINKNVLFWDGVYITDQNAATFGSKEYPAEEYKSVIKKVGYSLSLEYWTSRYKQRVMAEILVPEKVQPSYIHKIFVANENVLKKVSEMGINQKKHPIIDDPQMFFQPLESIEITEKLKLVRGDMFYSDKQTLTVSVNTVGVMGAGLASRAKNQFPDVFEEYLNALSSGELKMGAPYLYKRPDNFENVLVEMEEGDEGLIPSHWFLIFPTKNHWITNSDKEGIENGLLFLKDNYKKWGISSIALPALGCGLGRLSWEEIGPLMVKILKNLEIDVEIYLPNKIIPKEQLTKEFLLS